MPLPSASHAGRKAPRWRAASPARWTAKSSSMRRAAAAMRPTPRSTRSCRSAWCCRATPRRAITAMQIALDAGVAVLPRGARHLAVRPDGRRRPGDRRQQVPESRGRVRRQAARRAVVEPGMVLDHLNRRLRTARAVVSRSDVSTSAQATLGGMAGNNSCGSRSIALRQHGAQRARRSTRCWPTARCAFRPHRRNLGVRRTAASPARERSARIGERERDEIERALPEGAAPRRRLQPRHARAAARRHATWRICWSARRHARAVRRRIAPEARRRCRATRCSASCHFPTLLQGDGCGPAHREARPDRGGTGRPHHDRAGAARTRRSRRSIRRAS